MTYESELEMIPVKGTFKGERADQVLNTHYNVTKQYQLISQSNFNTIAKHLDIDPVNLSANEAFVYDSLYIEKLDFVLFTQEIQLYSLLEMNRKS